MLCDATTNVRRGSVVRLSQGPGPGRPGRGYDDNRWTDILRFAFDEIWAADRKSQERTIFARRLQDACEYLFYIYYIHYYPVQRYTFISLTYYV